MKANFKDKINTAGFQNKPENINKTGRPKKTIGAVNIELEKQGFTEASKNDIVSCYLRLIQLPFSELEIKIADITQPALISIVGKAILSGKGFDVIEKILDRGIGKANDNVVHSGEIKTNYPILTKEQIDRAIDKL